MRDELSCRRTEYRPGRAVLLADGQHWTFPAPTEGEPAGTGPFGPDYEALLRAIIEAEDQDERRRAELALAIELLACNYRLTTDDYAALLDFETGDPALPAVQAALGEIAYDHLRTFRSTAVEAPRRRGWGFLSLPLRLLGFHSVRRTC